MPTDIQFATDWLEERYRFDVAARNPQVEAACLQYLSTCSPINIIDIGTGTGANFIYLAEKFPQSQRWVLVELNPDLLKRARTRLTAWATANGYHIKPGKSSLHFKKDQQQIQVDFLKGSFLDLPRLLPLKDYDLVTASAVFDLLSKDMIQNLAQTFHENRLALLATLNYESMSYLPIDPADEQWIGLYEAHMQRQQEFGQALGPNCSAYLESCFARLSGEQLLRAPSRWQIEPADTEMHRHLLGFMETSLLEITVNGHSGKDLTAWLEHKKQQLKTQQLRLSVVHSDLFIAPAYEG